jgi:hypothetical protein
MPQTGSTACSEVDEEVMEVNFRETMRWVRSYRCGKANLDAYAATMDK